MRIYYDRDQAASVQIEEPEEEFVGTLDKVASKEA
jgi:hypothetical protein